MKKNLPSLVLALLMVVVASAKTAFLADGQSSLEVLPNETVAVVLHRDIIVWTVTLENIVERPAVGGRASDPWIHPGFDWHLFTGPGIPVNSGGILIEHATGKSYFDGVSGDLYGFDYTVPDIPVGTVWTIGPGEGSNNVGGVVPDPLTLTLIPEPMTIALVGLGALVVRRKR